MESLQNIKSRRRAVLNVGQITKAMEVVSTTKMRRAQEVAINSRNYAFHALSLLEKLSSNSPIENPLAEHREIKKTLLVISASDKGLTGAFNAQVLRAADKLITSKKFDQNNLAIVAIGKKAANYALKKKLNLVASFYEVGDYVDPEETSAINDILIQGFLKKEWDEVTIISTHFLTALKQEVLIRELLPINFKKIRQTVKEIIPETGRYSNIVNLQNNQPETIDYIFEPSPSQALNALIPHLIKMQIYHLILEANASEHSARRVAMKTASDNADDLGNELNLTYNKARQANITRELIEITSTQTALT